MELARAELDPRRGGGASDRDHLGAALSPLRRLWSRSSGRCRSIAYSARATDRHAERTSTARKQIADGAPRREDRDGAQRRRLCRRRAAGRAAATAPRPRRLALPAARCGSGSSAGWCRSRTWSPSSGVRHRPCATSTWTCASSAPPTRIPATRALPRSWSRRSAARRRSGSSGRCRPDSDLRRPRRRGADQLQRGPAAGDPGGLRLRACR